MSVMEVDRTYRTVTFESSCGTHVAISISADWLWNYLKDFHYVLPLPILKMAVIPKIIEFCYHYLEEPMVDILHGNNNNNSNHYYGPLIEQHHRMVQPPWYTSFLNHLSRDVKGELLIASRILHIQPLEDLIGATLSFPHKNYNLCDLREILFLETNSNRRPRQKRKLEGHQYCGSRKR
ncbi:unnamed protein product [Cylindrotheca closterium]|uniref:Uncharacterized protein n=1 Tax=Cylindrotheca closterium TaxID=2856 RepID=A0AAD2FRN5_9STRA|nr:unnamed protein product [Cylindrotheca closterium]